MNQPIADCGPLRQLSSTLLNVNELYHRTPAGTNPGIAAWPSAADREWRTARTDQNSRQSQRNHLGSVWVGRFRVTASRRTGGGRARMRTSFSDSALRRIDALPVGPDHVARLHPGRASPKILPIRHQLHSAHAVHWRIESRVGYRVTLVLALHRDRFPYPRRLPLLGALHIEKSCTSVGALADYLALRFPRWIAGSLQRRAFVLAAGQGDF